LGNRAGYPLVAAGGIHRKKSSFSRASVGRFASSFFAGGYHRQAIAPIPVAGLHSMAFETVSKLQSK